MHIGKLTSRAILASPLAQWGTYTDPNTNLPVRIKVVVNHQLQHWEDSVITRYSTISYAYSPDHPLRPNAIITIDNRDWKITETADDDGSLITSKIIEVSK